MRERSRRKNMQKVISLFSEAGGMDIGFEKAGFAIAVAVEKDPACCDTLRTNRLTMKTKATEGGHEQTDGDGVPEFPGRETEKIMGRVYKKSIIYAVCAVLLLVFLPAFINAEPVHAAGNNAKNYLGKAIYAENAGSDQVTWFSGAVGLNYTDGTSSVLTRPIDESEITDSGYLFGFIDAGGNVYDMEFAYTDPELGYTEWVLEGRGGRCVFPVHARKRP